jgi:hypothetical protein
MIEHVFEMEPNIFTWKDKLRLLFRQKQYLSTTIPCESRFGDGWKEYETVHTEFKTDKYGKIYIYGQFSTHTFEALEDIPLGEA